MKTAPKTTRDQLTLLLDLLSRATRHTWLVALIVIIGAGLSITLAMLQKPQYDSETVLLYQEKISQSIAQGKEVEKLDKVGTRFKEMLLSRTTLSSVVEEFNLFEKVVASQGTIAAAELMSLRIQFKDRGAGTYKISYRGDSPEEAQQVTARMAALLQEKDEKIRKDKALQTKVFLEGEKANAENTLFEAEFEYAVFVAKNPEFVADVMAAKSGVGASIRAASAKADKKPANSASSRLSALQRAAKRLRDRIDNPDAPVVAPRKVRRAESPALQAARSEYSDAKRSYEDKSQRFTPKHPDVISSKNNLAEAKRRLKRVEASDKARTPAPVIAAITTTTSVKDLKKELARVESLIARSRETSGDSAKPDESDLADELVTLETENARLQRKVENATQRLARLEARVFTAEITASSEFAEAAQLVIIDEAYLPAKPAGKGKAIVVIAGTVVFGFLGVAIALGLALIDDRVYRRADIDELGIAPVLVVIPKLKRRRRRG